MLSNSTDKVRHFLLQSIPKQVVLFLIAGSAWREGNSNHGILLIFTESDKCKMNVKQDEVCCKRRRG